MTSDGRNYVYNSNNLWPYNNLAYKIICDLNKQKCDEARRLVEEAMLYMQRETGCFLVCINVLNYMYVAQHATNQLYKNQQTIQVEV